jgi:imidazolonepropionase-like amidohydrolase
MRTLFLLFIALLTPAALAEDTPSAISVIHCGALLDEPGQAPRGNSTIIVRDGTIDDVLDGYVRDVSAPAGATVEFIDLTDQFVLPGLIDCHTHLTFKIPTMDVRLRRALTEGTTHSAIDGVVFAERTLMAGFTTVRNVGSAGSDIYALRARINEGVIPGPRILAAGKSISVTGGHADPTNGMSPVLRPEMTPMDGVADGPYEMRKAVRERVKQGSDLIKITATGGVLSNTAAGVDQQMFEDEIRAVVETARTMGRKVAAHAHGANGIKAAIRAGVDSIEHGTYLDDEAIELFKEHGCYLVPTIHAGKFVEEKAQESGYFNPAIREKAAAVGPQIQDAVGRAYRGGVKIAFGTDVGVGAHGTNAREFIYMHEAGIPAMDCIVSATVNAADLCGIGDRVGAIRKGMSADIIAVDTSPLEDLSVLQDVGFVMARGTVFKAPEAE